MGKKNPKPSSSSSSSSSPSPAPSPRTPATLRTPNLPIPRRGKYEASPVLYPVNNEPIDRQFLSATVAKYPSLIPDTDSAFYGSITDSESSHAKGNRSIVYLSESAMTSFSLRPGSLVSVFLPPSENQLEGDDCEVNNGEKYFAIATIYPSRAVIKNGVRLSWGLSCTLNFPNMGHSVFVSSLSTTFPINKFDILHLSLISSKTENKNEICGDSALRLALEDETTKHMVKNWLRGRHLLKGNIVGIPICFGKICMFEVLDSSSDFSAYMVDHSTKVEFVSDNGLLNSNDNGDGSVKDVLQAENDEVEECDWPILGGLSKEYAVLKRIIEFSLAEDHSLTRYKGVLLHGPPGTGKTSLACSCAESVKGARLFCINAPEIISQYFGESEQALRNIFDTAKKSAPSVIFIDELDAIAPARGDGNEELSLRMVSALLKLMDEIGRNDRVLLIAATNRPDSLEPALRRPGRLEKEIEIGVPSPKQRLEILVTILSDKPHSLSESQIETLSAETHGFVGADLAALCDEATFNALRRLIKSRKEKRDVSLSESLSKLSVSEKVNAEDEQVVKLEDFEKAKIKIRPSAMREVAIELPRVKWEDVGGQCKIKKQLVEAVQTNPEVFHRIGIRALRGILMIGPPGCSKTLMARAVASEAKRNFLAVKGPQLFSKWVGESEKAVKRLFEIARVNSPAIIFFDEIDALAATRGDAGVCVGDRVLSQLLVEMDGLELNKGITVIAATNRPDKIDPALLRPGRFDILLDVQPPDESDREEIFKIHTRNTPCGPDVKFDELAILTKGYTGADIKLLCNEAAISALKEDRNADEVWRRHFYDAIERVRPTDFKFYEDLASQFRRRVSSSSSIRE